MLTKIDVERLFSEWQTPEKGRNLIRKIRDGGPVRKLQQRMDGVRTRYISKKMGRALYAESRTCEFPGIYIREHDPDTTEMWPQPCQIDLMVKGENGSTRIQHTPDLFVIADGFIVEEWREEERLHRYAMQQPTQYYKDDMGRWHFVAAEEYFAELGITYRLRSSDEHPRVYLSNLHFLEDYTKESAPPVSDDVRQHVVALLAEHNKLPYTSLLYEHKFNADDLLQLVLHGDVYVDLERTLVRQTGELVLYRDKTVGQADALFNRAQTVPAIPSQLHIAVGSTFNYDGKSYRVMLLGDGNVQAVDKEGKTTELPIAFLQELFEKEQVESEATTRQSDTVDEYELFRAKHLDHALRCLAAINNPDGCGVPDRTLRRWRQKIQGATTVQEQIDALIPRYIGNGTARLPAQALELAEQAIREFYNQPAKPTTLAAYNHYVTLCSDAGVRPMSRTRFYEKAHALEDVRKREGKRMAYQKASIELTWDFDHPVHGVMPHEVVYCDHTIMNVFLKGSVLPDLGKPTITLMSDGSLSKARAFYLSYAPASTVTVMMCIRDYVRRHGRVMKVLVLDNGREFHSEALKLFCSVFGITLRWRRRSRPRDSAIIERMLGATEQEVISQLDGNSLALKDPRMVSSSHLPQKHIAWTLPALHGAIDYFLFSVHPERKHPRFGISLNEMEIQMNREYGTRDFCAVRDDKLFRLMTSPHSGSPTRIIDRQRGVYVDGVHYWNEALAQAKAGEECEIRVELWHSRIVYLNFRKKWYMAQARDGGRLQGRFRQEFELQRRVEAARRRGLANKDRITEANSRKRKALWIPEMWDSRLREQMTETYVLYERLGMTEVFEEARNPYGTEVNVPMPRGSDLEMIYAVQGEPDRARELDVDDEANDEKDEQPPASNEKLPSLRATSTHSTGPKVPRAAAPQHSKAGPTPAAPRIPHPAGRQPVVVTEDDYF